MFPLGTFGWGIALLTGNTLLGLLGWGSVVLTPNPFLGLVLSLGSSVWGIVVSTGFPIFGDFAIPGTSGVFAASSRNLSSGRPTLPSSIDRRLEASAANPTWGDLATSGVLLGGLAAPIPSVPPRNPLWADVVLSGTPG